MRRAEVVEFLRGLAARERAALDQLKRDATQFGQHQDWPWNGLVLSAATRGGSWRWEKNVQPRYEDELSWSIISELTPDERRTRLETVGRFWRKTADWLENAYHQVAVAGGPTELRMQLSRMSASDVIAFWKALNDIKDKYARNIMMDVYDLHFRTAFFAIDSRLESLLPLLGYDGQRRYSKREEFLCQLASDIGIQAWDLDRLLYGQHAEIKASLAGAA